MGKQGRGVQRHATRGVTTSPNDHRGHKMKRIGRVADFCGRRLHTEIMRCDTCGGALVSVQQYAVRRGQR